MANRFFRATIWDAQALASGGTLESPVIDLTACELEYFLLALTTGTNPGVKVQFQYSDSATTFTNAYADNDDITSSTLVDYATTPNSLHSYLIPRHKYIQIKLTEIAAVATTVTGHLELSEVV